MNNTTNLSNFPTSIDTFERMSDISCTPIADGEQSTLEKSKIYKEIIEAGNYEDAEKYLKENKDLAKCAINATMVNKHSDAIVALEETVNDNNRTLVNKIDSIEKTVNDNKQTLDRIDSIHIKGGTHISVSNEQNNIIISHKRENICSNKLLYSDYAYQGHQVFAVIVEQDIAVVSGAGSAGIEFDHVFGGTTVNPYLIDIIGIDGFISTPRFNPHPYYAVPKTCYPLNSSNVDIHWSNSINIGDSVIPDGQKAEIHIDLKDISPSISTATANLLVKFICT